MQSTSESTFGLHFCINGKNPIRHKCSSLPKIQVDYADTILVLHLVLEVQLADTYLIIKFNC